MGHNYLYVEVAVTLLRQLVVMKLVVSGKLTWPTIMKLGLKITWPLIIKPAVVNANNYVGVAIDDFVISMVNMH